MNGYAEKALRDEAFQVKFKTSEGYTYGGIAIYDNDIGELKYVINGQNGYVMAPSEVEILKEYQLWAPLSLEIIGDD